MSLAPPWLIRVASHPSHGGGHVSRMRVLARALRAAGADVFFVLDEGAGGVSSSLKRDGFACVENGEEGQGRWAGCILDGYDILEGEMDRWKAIARPVVVLDDFLNPPLGCDLVINSAPYITGNSIHGVAALLGPEFALIDPKYARGAMRDRDGSVDHVLIFFGRNDEDNFALKALEGLCQVQGWSKVTVVTGGATPGLRALQEALVPLGNAAELLLDTPDMVQSLKSADIAIGAGGVSLLERMAAGVPSITFAISDNQRLFVEGAARLGATLYGGAYAELTAPCVAEKVQILIADHEQRQRQASKGRALVDGRGAARVAERVLDLTV